MSLMVRFGSKAKKKSGLKIKKAISNGEKT